MTVEIASNPTGDAQPLRLRLRSIGDPWPILGLVLLIASWWGAHAVIGPYLPSPYEVGSSAVSNLFSSVSLSGLGLPEGGYLPHLLSTTLLTVAGVVIGSLLGMVSGFACGRFGVVNAIVGPVLSIFGTIPILVATPFFLIWFGLALSAKVGLVAFYSMVLVHLYTLRSIDHVPPFYAEYAWTLGASRSRTFRDVVFPASVPEMFGGIRLALSSAWGLSTIAELMGSRVGIGRLIAAAWAAYDLVAMMAALLWLCLIAVAFDFLLMRLRALITRWTERPDDAEVW